MVASGPINLGGATLNASIGGGYTPTLGDQLTIIHNTSGSAITGTFAQLAEGSGVTISGSLFRITYQGGSSHQDVVLTAVAATTSTTISASVPTSLYGQSVTFTAQVSGSTQGIPTGTVVFYDGNPTAGGTVVASRTARRARHGHRLDVGDRSRGLAAPDLCRLRPGRLQHVRRQHIVARLGDDHPAHPHRHGRCCGEQDLRRHDDRPRSRPARQSSPA